MRVFEAVGSGLDNNQLLLNCVGVAKFTYGTAGATVANNNFSFGSSAQTSADGFMRFTWASKFGTVAPNLYFAMSRQDSTAVAQCNVMAVGSNSCDVMIYLLTHAQLTATKAVGASVLTGAQTAPGTVYCIGYQATGTVFTTA